jgi:histone H3/H4
MEREKPKDLNYLFFRQQVERSRAEIAASEAAREAHEELAEAYEEQIEESTAETFTLASNNHRATKSGIDLS